MEISNLTKIILISISLIIANTSSYAINSQQCEKYNYNNMQSYHEDNIKYLNCINNVFSKAITQSKYNEIQIWLKKPKVFYSDIPTYFLNILMCENNKSFVDNRKSIIEITDQLITLGASINSHVLINQYTPLICIVNKKDSKLLDHILARSEFTNVNLNRWHSEGGGVPLYSAIFNNDLDSAKVLVKYGAKPDFSRYKNESALKVTLKSNNLKIANWLLDIGASVHKKDEEKGCSGKSALDYALEISETIEEKKQIVSRIRKLTFLPSSFKDNCNKLVHNKPFKN